MKIWERQSSIRLAQDMSKCLDAGAMTDGDILQLWTCNGLPQQRFGYDENMGTVYLSSSTSTSDASKCIDVTGGSLEAGTNLEVNDCTGCWNQQFSTVNSDSLSFLSHRTSSSNTGIQSQSCPPKPTPPAPPSPTPSPSPWPAPPSPPPSPYPTPSPTPSPYPTPSPTPWPVPPSPQPGPSPTPWPVPPSPQPGPSPPYGPSPSPWPQPPSPPPPPSPLTPGVIQDFSYNP